LKCYKNFRKETEKKFVLKIRQKGYDTFPKSFIYNFENTDEESTLFSISTGNSPLATRNWQLQLATRNSQLATRNSTTRILPTPIFHRNWQLASGNWQLATRNCNSQLATRNSQLATRNSQLATRNSQLATRNLHSSHTLSKSNPQIVNAFLFSM